jgi:hypothetical protein
MNHRLVGIALVLGLATGVATACSSSDSGTASERAVAPYEANGSEADGSGANGSGAGEQDSQGEKPAAKGRQDIGQPGLDRTLVRTANIALTAQDVTGTVDRARDIAIAENGYTGREEVRDAAATITLHIPSDRFDRALDALSALGRVRSREQSAEDVTEQVVDLDSRITTQRASVARVRTLLAKAGTVDEIVRIEQEVTSREADLESLQQRRQALAGQVALSTVTVRITRSATPPAPPEEEASGFVAGLGDGWTTFLVAGAVALQVLGALLPFLLLFGIPAALVLRHRRRRRVTAPTAAEV